MEGRSGPAGWSPVDPGDQPNPPPTGEVGGAYERVDKAVDYVREVANELTDRLERAGVLSPETPEAIPSDRIREVVTAPFAERLHTTAAGLERTADLLKSTLSRLQI